MYSQFQFDPLDQVEWENRTKSNVEACDAIAKRNNTRPLTLSEIITIGKMVRRQMQYEKENKCY